MVPWKECPIVEQQVSWEPRETVAALSEAQVAEGAALLREVLRELPATAAAAADFARALTHGRFHGEMRAAAERLGVSWRQIMLANISYDMAMAVFGCSTAALATPEGPVIARNLDWWPEEPLARASLSIYRRDGDRLHSFFAGWPGFSGVVTGMSGRGFGVVLNAVSGPEGVSLTGYPVLLFLRRVIEDAADFDEALALLKTTRLAAPCLITLAGVENHQRVVIERSPTRAALRWPDGDAPLITTNDYRLLFSESEGPATSLLYQTACGRFDAMTLLTGELGSGRIEDEALLEILADPDVLQSITVQHVVMRPALREARAYVPSHLLAQG